MAHASERLKSRHVPGLAAESVDGRLVRWTGEPIDHIYSAFGRGIPPDHGEVRTVKVRPVISQMVRITRSTIYGED